MTTPEVTGDISPSTMGIRSRLVVTAGGIAQGIFVGGTGAGGIAQGIFVGGTGAGGIAQGIFVGGTGAGKPVEPAVRRIDGSTGRRQARRC